MRVAKLEPHVASALRDGEDVQTFMSDLEELDKMAKPTSSDVGVETSLDAEKSHEDEVKEGFVRFMDYLKRKNKESSQSLKYIALQRYRYQRDLFSPDKLFSPDDLTTYKSKA